MYLTAGTLLVHLQALLQRRTVGSVASRLGRAAPESAFCIKIDEVKMWSPEQRHYMMHSATETLLALTSFEGELEWKTHRDFWGKVEEIVTETETSVAAKVQGVKSKSSTAKGIQTKAWAQAKAKAKARAKPCAKGATKARQGRTAK